MKAVGWAKRLIFAALPITALFLWLKWAGSFSAVRDGITVAVLLLLLAVLSWRWAGNASREPGRIRRTFDIVARFAAIWVIVCWAVLSTLDSLFPGKPLAHEGWSGQQSSKIDPDYSKLKVSLALSGGGYRAALIHVGVLDELARHGVPVTNLSSVSGGSIIAAFVATGGNPMAFADAVAAGRFRLKRELTSALTLPRWIFPWFGPTRRDIQAEMLRRVLLPADEQRSRGPNLMLGMTDLVRGIRVGATADGYMMAGPTTSRFFKAAEAMRMDGLGDLADIVAISGAFPGAFPAKHLEARYRLHSADVPMSGSIRLALSDGGVRDNIGLGLLERIHEHATGTNNTWSGWSGNTPTDAWRQDLVIVSDGGAVLEASEPSPNPIAEAGRAIDLSGLETGVVRLVDMTSLAKIFLAIPSRFHPMPDSVLVAAWPPAGVTQHFFFVRPERFTVETLKRIAELASDAKASGTALANYLADRPRSTGEIGGDDRCAISGSEVYASPLCSRWRLIQVIGTDVEQVISTFLASETLRDDYSQEDVDRLVRLGRYFVLFAWPDLKNCLDAMVRSRNGAEPQSACVQ
ncbi:patatin-like phospholipase family protein [Pinisolibacter sp.]|uniref:patatin-like phospholipase family protein n=1 Tax=Pinisolibacter sp. TaxID=2172024 RepID=UPI002FDEE352